jgi:putative peptidoglycan lipid II flippase
MTTPRSQAGQTAADSGSVPSPAGQDADAEPGLARPYADPARGYVTAAPEYDEAAATRGSGGYDYDATLPPGWPGAVSTETEADAEPAAADEPADLFPAGSQADGSWPEPDLGSEEQLAADVRFEDQAGTRGGRGGADWADADEASADRAPAYRAPAHGASAYEASAYEASADRASADETGADEGSAAQVGASVMRSSGVMAIGTLASRGTGLLRTLVQAWALGAATLSVAYNNANTLPNVVYNLVIGGILTSVIVPLLVSAAKRDHDRGEAYDQRMFTLVTFALLALTIVATLAAAPLVDLYKGSISGPEQHLMVLFAYFFIPQIFFYGVSSLAGAILNARGSFAAPMWTPVLNNVVVIAVLLMFVVVAGLDGSPTTITSGEIQLVGLGTTLGVVAQTIALLPALRRVGFRWRMRTDFRRAEVAEIGKMGGWMFGYIAATQVAFLVTTLVANIAGVRAAHAGVSYANYTAYSYGWQLFQMPYAVVGISVITALLPRMSAHAAERRLNLVRQDFSVGVRLSSVIVVPCSLVLAVLGPQLGEVFLAHGSTNSAGGRYEGEVFALFCLGLLPYMFFQLQLRVFYALHDSRTPALIGLATMTLNIAANLLALEILPSRDVVAGLGVGFGLANVLGTIVAWRVLSGRLGGLDGRAVTGSLLRMHGASIPPAIFAIATSLTVGVVVPAGHLNAAITVVVAGCGGLLLYVMFAKAFRVSELTDLSETVTGRFRR